MYIINYVYYFFYQYFNDNIVYVILCRLKFEFKFILFYLSSNSKQFLGLLLLIYLDYHSPGKYIVYEYTMRVVEFFSGIGGMHFALKGIINSFYERRKQKLINECLNTLYILCMPSNIMIFTECDLKDFEVVLAVDINTVANTVYRHFFPSTNLRDLNILSLSPEQFDAYSPDMLLMSPPCQPFTRQNFKLFIYEEY